MYEKQSEKIVEAQSEDYDFRPQLGSILGEYKLIKQLGAGGQSLVYEVEHTLIKQRFALKLLLPDRIPNRKTIQRLQREAEAVSSLHHQNIVSLRGYHLTPAGQPYLVMDLVPGTSLEELLEARGGRLEISEVMSVATQICDALELAHGKDILHRDLKPRNIMVGQQPGQMPKVTVIDFGVAKMAVESGHSITNTGETVGSPEYMSPEQCEGFELDGRSDVYSLGCVLYRALTGTKAVSGGNVLHLMMNHLTGVIAPFEESLNIPASVEGVVMRCLKKDPADRYQKVADLKQALIEAESGKNVESFQSRNSSRVRESKPTKRSLSQRLTMYAIISIMCSGLAAIVAMWPLIAVSLAQWSASDLNVQQAQTRASVLLQQGKLADAEALLESVIMSKSSFAENAARTLATIYATGNQSEKVEAMWLEFNHGDLRATAEQLHYTGAPFIYGHKAAQGRPVLLRAANIFKKLGGEKDKGYVKELLFLARADAEEGNQSLALKEYKSAVPQLESSLGSVSQYTIAAKQELAELEDDMRKAAPR